MIHASVHIIICDEVRSFVYLLLQVLRRAQLIDSLDFTLPHMETILKCGE